MDSKQPTIKNPVTWKRKLKIQFFVFLALFIFVEIILRLFGMKAGTLIDDFKIQENPVYEQRFTADEMGINYIKKGATTLMLGTKINEQGFRDTINYTPEIIDSLKTIAKKKIVMIVGDSYVEGCCPDTVTNSFPDIINRNSKYKVLNLGISGTDPLQYQLVLQKYAPRLKPDIIVVAFYFGNDILTFERSATPYAPLTFPFKDNKWLFGVAPNHLSQKLNYSFETAKEAYQFYIDKYTLAGKDRNYIEKVFRYSVICSKLYLYIEHRNSRKLWESKGIVYNWDGFDIAHKRLSAIRKVADSLQIKTVFVGIPSPEEATNKENLKEKYKTLFKEIELDVPTNLTKEDYDGMNISNHFNNAGHKKYAIFLEQVIESKK
jgi:hypothetical protein